MINNRKDFESSKRSAKAFLNVPIKSFYAIFKKSLPREQKTWQNLELLFKKYIALSNHHLCRATNFIPTYNIDDLSLNNILLLKNRFDLWDLARTTLGLDGRFITLTDASSSRIVLLVTNTSLEI